MAAIEVKAYNPEPTDDTHAVNTDINDLYNRVIKKIDSIRSSTNIMAGLGITAAGTHTIDTTIKQLNTDQQPNAVRFMESRAHAFYRALGLPTAEPGGTFYSPGHNPRTDKNKKLNEVDQKLLSNETVIRLLGKRETDPNDRRKIFANQDINSTAYSLAMRHVLPFNLIDNNNTDPFYNDPQASQIAVRYQEMVYYSCYVAKKPIDLTGKLAIASNPAHILKPFIVSPTEKALPINKRVAAPFLPDPNDLVIEKSAPPLRRPEIEYIIRRRLQNEKTISQDSVFYKNVERLLGDPTNPQTTDETRSFVLALTGSENIGSTSSEFLRIVRGLTDVQVTVISMFIREIKGLIKQLNLALREIDYLKQYIIWQPVPNKEGPEFGGMSKYGGDGSATSFITQNIASLELQQLSQLVNSIDSEEYALVLDVDTQVNFDENIAVLKSRREKLGSIGIQHLREIELITGEVSGLGLIDVLAIHTALWAIDIDTLLGFLDADAFDRLYTHNHELRVSNVNNRKLQGAPSINETLQKFEQQVLNVLSFAQDEVERNKKNPRQVPSSNIR